ncbi:MAG: hypothetical protein NVSMB27_17630 [Ktedonobacteraceae bacterium]
MRPREQVWFGLLSGGAIGHLDPATGHVALYRLADPQAQVFAMASDANGRFWFTEIVPGKLGMLDPIHQQDDRNTCADCPESPRLALRARHHAGR